MDITDRQRALFQLVKDALDNLPVLHASNVPKDESCAICLTPFDLILASDLPQRPPAEEEGVTRVAGCGHLFCRKDLSEWIRNFHGSCPTCRHPFLDIIPYSESDADSSDSEYIPEDDEDEEDDFFGIDGFEDEFEMQEMEVDLEDIWDDWNEDEANESGDDLDPDIDSSLDEHFCSAPDVAPGDDDK